MTSTKYITAVGRRKTAIASVRIAKASKNVLTVNGVPANQYFKTAERTSISLEALSKAEANENYEIYANVTGGGISAQADAVRHAISRALVKAEPKTKQTLKPASFLTRDPRAKERKKPGHVKARKSKQWSKR